MVFVRPRSVVINGETSKADGMPSRCMNLNDIADCAVLVRHMETLMAMYFDVFVYGELKSGKLQK